MKRLNPVGSLFGYFLTVLLFIGLGFSLWYNRGLAFSPGPVTAISKDGVSLQGFSSHAEFEKRCSYCHEPIKTDLASKCKECHENVNQQILIRQGIHSQIGTVNECVSCHADHRGRDFNPTQASYKLFDHSTAAFNLNWHQENYDATPMECNACHINDDYSVVPNQECLDCHSNHEITFAQAHTQDFGADCLSCHDGSDRMQNFDHDQTGYRLVGIHAQINCTKCHQTGNLNETPSNCMNCHTEPTIHQGMFEQTCDSCHTPDGWSPAIVDNRSFSHTETAFFSLNRHKLDYSNQLITCSTCHSMDLQILDIQTCINCHGQHDQKFMADHLEQFGSECLSCHDGFDRLSNFEHANFFSLDGKHSLIQCSDCHTEKDFRGTPNECWQCHHEPEIHAGVFGLKCFYCHIAEGWSPANLRQHSFPLNHGLVDQNLELQCDTCHGTSYIDYTCYNCHDHQSDVIQQSHQADGITHDDLRACVNCHPSGNLEQDIGNP